MSLGRNRFGRAKILTISTMSMLLGHSGCRALTATETKDVIRPSKGIRMDAGGDADLLCQGYDLRQSPPTQVDRCVESPDCLSPGTPKSPSLALGGDGSSKPFEALSEAEKKSIWQALGEAEKSGSSIGVAPVNANLSGGLNLSDGIRNNDGCGDSNFCVRQILNVSTANYKSVLDAGLSAKFDLYLSNFETTASLKRTTEENSEFRYLVIEARRIDEMRQSLFTISGDYVKHFFPSSTPKDQVAQRDAFYQNCGTHYASTKIQGAKLTIFARYLKNTDNHDFNARIDIKVNSNGANGGIDRTDHNDNTYSDIWIQADASKMEKLGNTFEDALTLLSNFPDEKKNAPKTIAYILDDYTFVKRPNDKMPIAEFAPMRADFKGKNGSQVMIVAPTAEYRFKILGLDSGGKRPTNLDYQAASRGCELMAASAQQGYEWRLPSRREMELIAQRVLSSYPNVTELIQDHFWTSPEEGDVDFVLPKCGGGDAANKELCGELVLIKTEITGFQKVAVSASAGNHGLCIEAPLGSSPLQKK